MTEGISSRSVRGSAPSITESDPADSPLNVGAGVLLTAVAGYVDAVGYLALGGFFASFMSGASISVGIAASGSRWTALYEGVRLILVFLAGVISATVTDEIAKRWALPVVLVLEGGLLIAAAFMSAHGWTNTAAILPVVAAMGVQNTALRPLDRMRLGVTFMTGTLVALGQGIGRSLLGRVRVRQWSGNALLWAAFCFGAAVGALGYARHGFVAVVEPAVLVFAIAIVASVLRIRTKRHRHMRI